MIPPDPSQLSGPEVGTILGLSLLGGAAAFANRLRTGDIKGPIWLEFTTDVLYALAAGVSAWFLFGSLTGCPWLSGAAALICAHLGARWLTLAQRIVLDRFGDSRPEA